MIRHKQKFLILGGVMFLLGLNLLLAPYLNKREATKIVNTVLQLWTEGKLAEAFYYWENPQQTPPVYDLVSSSVNKKIFTKKDGMWEAQIFATLEFPAGNILPSGREWVFELKTTKLGWKVTGFRLAE